MIILSTEIQQKKFSFPYDDRLYDSGRSGSPDFLDVKSINGSKRHLKTLPYKLPVNPDRQQKFYKIIAQLGKVI